MQSKKIDENSLFYVGFSNETDLVYLKILKKGFRHCFLLYGDRYRTVVIDPVCNKIEIKCLLLDVNIVKNYFVDKGMKFLTVKNVWKTEMSVRVGVFTCVEVVKRFLGIANPFILTPYRLYKYLIK